MTDADFNSNRDRGSTNFNRDSRKDVDIPDEQWVSDAQLQEALEMEQKVFGRDLDSGASKKLARRLFEENAAAAAQSIIKTAVHGSTEKVRFDAAKYVLERALGPTANPYDRAANDNDPLEAAVQELMGNKTGPSKHS